MVGEVDGVFVTFDDMFRLEIEEFLDALPFGPPFRSLL